MPVAVYVHLGPELPKHLQRSLNRHKSLFPNQEIVLISSHDQSFKIPAGIEEFKVNTDELEVELFQKMSQNLDFGFRNGFWKYTLQRFFAIHEFHRSVADKAITHIESDVLIMPNFPWDKFNKLTNLAWLKVNSDLDIAAIVHSPSLRHTQMLSKAIVDIATAKPGTNDMIALHESVALLKSNHEYLPSLTSSNVQSHFVEPQNHEERIKYFGGIFDPLALGLWYFGQDPKNSFGFRMRYIGDSSHDLNPLHTRLSIKNGVLSDQNGTLVYCLHIHSKVLSLFGENWEKSLKNQLIEASKQEKRFSFSLKAAYQAVKARQLKDTLWILMALVPGLKQLRKYKYFEDLKNFAKNLFQIGAK